MGRTSKECDIMGNGRCIPFVFLFPLWCIIGACSPTEYRSFAFVPVDPDISIVPKEIIFQTHFSDEAALYTYLLSAELGLRLIKQRSEQDALYLMLGKDTIPLKRILQSDTSYFQAIPINAWEPKGMYTISGKSFDNTFLFVSLADNLWAGPIRLHLIFECHQNRVIGMYGYGTYTFLPEGESCTACITDYKRDGKLDFVQMPLGDNGTDVHYIHFQSDGREHTPTGYISVWKKDLPAAAATVVVKKRFKKRYLKQ